MQLAINFENIPTGSPLNIEKLSGQNRRLLEYLLNGGSIHCMSSEMKRLGIGYLNSRIADLRRYLRYSEFEIETKPHVVDDTHVKIYRIKKANPI